MYTYIYIYIYTHLNEGPASAGGAERDARDRLRLARPGLLQGSDPGIKQTVIKHKHINQEQLNTHTTKTTQGSDPDSYMYPSCISSHFHRSTFTCVHVYLSLSLFLSFSLYVCVCVCVCACVSVSVRIHMRVRARVRDVQACSWSPYHFLCQGHPETRLLYRQGATTTTTTTTTKTTATSSTTTTNNNNDNDL